MSGAPGVGRVLVEDVRRNGGYLRVTWHGDARTFVVSNWEGDVCVGASRLDVSGAAQVAHLLTDGIAAAATAPPATPPAAAPSTLGEHLRTWWRHRSRRAPVVRLRPHPHGGGEVARSA